MTIAVELGRKATKQANIQFGSVVQKITFKSVSIFSSEAILFRGAQPFAQVWKGALWKT